MYYSGLVVLGLCAVVAPLKFSKAAKPLALATLLGAAVCLGVGGWIGKAGGTIRHPEFRGEPQEEEEYMEQTMLRGKAKG